MIRRINLLPLALLLLLSSSSSSSASATDERISSVIEKDVRDLRTELEKSATNSLKKYQFLSQSQLIPDAERALREAIAAAPWMAAPYALLGTHLLDHGRPAGKAAREAMEMFARAMRIDHALLLPSKEKTGSAMTANELMKTLHKVPSFSSHFTGQTFYARLKHDRDQLEYLGDKGKLPRSVVDRWLQGYDRLLGMVPPEHRQHAMNLPPDIWAETIGSIYQRAVYVPEVPPLDGPALNPNLNFRELEEQYLSSDPKFVTFDDLLTQEALLALRTYYEEATIFWDTKPGYVGAYIFDGGFGNPIVAQLMEELVEAFPRLICTHRLNQAWAYKYDSDIANPIDVHADIAAVNFNFWISPDEGNLDPDGGGLVVYKVAPPPETPMEVFNKYPLHPNVTNMLSETNYANHSVPYKSNRAVIFQSDLFHRSGKMNWDSKAGYDKRRINLTLLFGNMRGKCGDEDEDKEKG